MHFNHFSGQQPKEKNTAMKTTTRILALVAALLLAVPGFTQNFPGASGNPSIISRPGGLFYAPAFNWQGFVVSGNSATGSQSITVTSSQNGLTLPDGTVVPLQAIFSTLVPIVVDYGQGNQETVTPTAVSVGACPSGNLGVGAAYQCATVTASFSNTHGQSAIVRDGSFGLQTAINYAQSLGGGIVSVDQAWAQSGGTTAMLNAAVPFPSVSVLDMRSSAVQYWNVNQAASTALATPTTLTAVTALPSATPVGAYGTGTYHFCISYVDIMGNEGTCSADFSQAGLATGSFIFSAPAASTGAVGYTIYISLTGGTYALSYKVPLTSSICTLTKVETVTAACAVTNTTYAQTGATATVTAITVNTAMLAPNATTISSTSDYVPNPNARTLYAYIPSMHVGLPGVLSSSLVFPVGAAAGSTVPDVIGTLTLPAGFMNYVGRTIEVCGYATEASAGSTATISNMQLWWDAAGSNAAGVPVLIGTIPSTNTLVTANTDQFYFCYDLKTTVAGAGVTAGSIMQTGGYYINQYTTSSVATVPKTVLGQGPAAVGSLNLAGEARIEVVWLHTTGTDGAGVQLQDLTVKVLN